MHMVRKLLHSTRFAIAIIVALVSVMASLAFAFVGWLGIALVGLLGLTITTRMDINDGHAVADFDYGSSSVHMLARQIEQQRNARHQDREQRDTERRQRKRLIYVLNTLWLAMLGLGFVMFSVHQV